MPDYEFFVSNGAPTPATREIRSHAMRTALQRRARKQQKQQATTGGATECKAKTTAASPSGSGRSDSRKTVRQRAALQGKFRVSVGGEKRATRHGREGVKEARGEEGEEAEKETAQAVCAAGTARPAAGIGDPDSMVVAVSVPAASTRRIKWMAAWMEGGASDMSVMGSGVIDPFSALPIPNSKGVDLLIKYCELNITYLFSIPSFPLCLFANPNSPSSNDTQLFDPETQS
jgi:hypothetical protein